MPKMNLRLISLDLDGVLNNHIDKECINQHKRVNFSKHNIKLLNKLIEETSTKDMPTQILLSSSWRNDYTNAAGVNCLFETTGVYPRCIGITPYFHGDPRGLEICDWIFKNQIRGNYLVKHLCILDDDSDMEMMAPWHVKTDTKFGLTENEFVVAKEMLMRPFSLSVNLGI